MGLFGGFKAKFTRNSKPKEKPEAVVCLKYHINSEFDKPNASTNTPKETSKYNVIHKQVRHKRPPIESAIFGENINHVHIPQKSLSLNNLNFKSSTQPEIEYGEHIKNSKATNNHTEKASINDVSNSSSLRKDDGGAKDTTNYLYSSGSNSFKSKNEVIKIFSPDDDYEEVTPREEMVSILDKKQSENRTNGSFNEQSTLISMTQHSSNSARNSENAEDNFMIKTEPSKHPQELSKDRTITNLTESFDREDDFKVNYARHSFDKSYSVSEDELSNTEDENELYNYVTQGYSSAAASIFFGDDMHPTTTRPRKLLLKDEDNNKDDNDEADC